MIKTTLISLLVLPCFYLGVSTTLKADEPALSTIISGQFKLRNHHGEVVSQDSYQGFYRLVFFGFTDCPDICPTTMHKISQLMRKLEGKSADFVPLFISVDHEKDNVERVARYVDAFHPSIVGLTGTQEQIHNAAKGFKTTYGKNTGGSAQFGSWYHSSYLYLMDRNGKLLDIFSISTSNDILLEELARLP